MKSLAKFGPLKKTPPACLANRPLPREISVVPPPLWVAAGFSPLPPNLPWPSFLFFSLFFFPSPFFLPPAGPWSGRMMKTQALGPPCLSAAVPSKSPPLKPSTLHGPSPVPVPWSPSDDGLFASSKGMYETPTAGASPLTTVSPSPPCRAPPSFFPFRMDDYSCLWFRRGGGPTPRAPVVIRRPSLSPTPSELRAPQIASAATKPSPDFTLD